ncbi:MAG: hypothetical protein AB1473_19000 [Thermodesulfobacteriota bacterium]
MNTPMHCPGFEANKNLTSVTFKCPSCSKTVEIFSDEFDRPHKCPGCKQPIDFTKVSIEGSPA